MIKTRLTIGAVLFLAFGVGAALAADEARLGEEPLTPVPSVEADGQCGAGLEFVGEIEGITYNHIAICSCETDADCDSACGDEGGVCKELNTVPCPPPMPSGSCLCGASSPRPQPRSTGP